LEKPQSNQRALAPFVRCLAKARHALAPVLLRGPAAIGHPWPGAANPASMPGCPLRRTSSRPLEGALRSKAEGELTLDLMSGGNQKRTRSPVGAGLPAKSVWTTRSFRQYALSLTSIASKLAPTVLNRVNPIPCRSRLAGDGGGSVDVCIGWRDAIVGTPPATSRLLQGIGVHIRNEGTRAPKSQVGFQAASAAVAVVAPSRGRVEVLRSGQPGMDAGLAAHGQGWPIAAGPRSRTGARACRA